MANNNTEVTFEIMEHIGVLVTYDNREQAWTKEDLNKTAPMRDDMAR